MADRCVLFLDGCVSFVELLSCLLLFRYCRYDFLFRDVALSCDNAIVIETYSCSKGVCQFL